VIAAWPEARRRLELVTAAALARSRGLAYEGGATRRPGARSGGIMKRLALAVALAALAAPAAARQPKTYQVTGQVLDVTDDLIVVQKGKEKFEIGRTPDTKVTGELKQGGKATIEYRMTAATAEAKADKAGGKAGAKK